MQNLLDRCEVTEMLKHGHCINVACAGNHSIDQDVVFYKGNKMQVKKNVSKRNLKPSDFASVCLT